jgi:hypothetical protein
VIYDPVRFLCIIPASTQSFEYEKGKALEKERKKGSKFQRQIGHPGLDFEEIFWGGRCGVAVVIS